MTATATEQTLTLDRKQFAAAFSEVARVVPTRTPKEILKNVKLRVDDGGITLLATDEETAIRYRMDCDVSGMWACLLPAQRMALILRELTADEFTLTVDGGRAVIESGGSEFRLAVASDADFPPVEAELGESYLEMDSAALATAIKRTIFACDVESTRYALGGVCWGEDDGAIHLVTTDSRRLSVSYGLSTITVGVSTSKFTEMVVPQKAMALIASATDNSENVQVSRTENAIVAHCGPVAIWSRLVDGRFPKWQDVVPESFAHEIPIFVRSLHSAVRQAWIMTSDESAGVDFVLAGGTLALKSQAADVGESHIELPVASDVEMTVTLDPKYVDEFLRVLPDGESVEFCVNDSENAVMLRCDGCRYVVMPLSREK